MRLLQSHCVHGHELSEGNYYEAKLANGKIRFVCKTCHAKSTKAYENNEHQKAYRKKYYNETRSAFWRRYSVLKAAAKKFKRQFELSLEQYTELVRNGSCSYCGKNLPKMGAGIDRRDNKFGYILENVLACCERCNESKGRLEGLGFEYPRTEELLLELVKKRLMDP